TPPAPRPRSLANAPRVDRRRVVGVDRDPRVERVLIDTVARIRVAGRPRSSGPCRTCKGEADDQCASPLQEGAARELLLVQEAGHHLPPFAIVAAACLIAVKMRG